MAGSYVVWAAVTALSLSIMASAVPTPTRTAFLSSRPGSSSGSFLHSSQSSSGVALRRVFKASSPLKAATPSPSSLGVSPPQRVGVEAHLEMPRPPLLSVNSSSSRSSISSSSISPLIETDHNNNNNSNDRKLLASPNAKTGIDGGETIPGMVDRATESSRSSNSGNNSYVLASSKTQLNGTGVNSNSIGNSSSSSSGGSKVSPATSSKQTPEQWEKMNKTSDVTSNSSNNNNNKTHPEQGSSSKVSGTSDSNERMLNANQDKPALKQATRVNNNNTPEVVSPGNETRGKEPKDHVALPPPPLSPATPLAPKASSPSTTTRSSVMDIPRDGQQQTSFVPQGNPIDVNEEALGPDNNNNNYDLGPDTDLIDSEVEEGEGRESGVGGGGGIVPQVVNGGKFSDDEDSHFFAYFLTIMVTAIIFYLVFHNKQRIIALIIEGRAPSSRGRRSSSRARYHKLDNNLEEAMSVTKGNN